MYQIVVPRQIDNDGPVVLVQIENEYGAYGDDKSYLRHLVDATRAAGITVPLTTIDQPFDLAKGSLPGELHMTASLGSRSKERLATNHDTILTLPAGPAQELTVLVEDQGRVNYASRIGEHKGLIGPALLNGVELNGWTIRPLDLSDPEGIAARLTGGTSGAGPAFLRAQFDGAAPGGDLHLSTRGLGKGVAWVNGFNLGRYWSRGPQHSLFVPGQLIRAGVNTVLIMELNGTALKELSFTDQADLGHTEL